MDLITLFGIYRGCKQIEYIKDQKDTDLTTRLGKGGRCRKRYAGRAVQSLSLHKKHCIPSLSAGVERRFEVVSLEGPQTITIRTNLNLLFYHVRNNSNLLSYTK